MTLLFQYFNLIILILIIYQKSKKPLAHFIKERAAQLSSGLSTAADEIKLRTTEHDEVSRKLAQLQSELDWMEAEANTEIASHKEKFASMTKAMEAQARMEVKRRVNEMTEEFKQGLRKKFANQVIDRAEVLLKGRVTGQDRDKVLSAFSTHLEEIR